jgi:hypothetical protein
MDWSRIRMSGRFKGRSIFCPNRGAVPKYTLGDGNTCRRSREPLAASLQSCHTIKRLPSKALGHSDTCRRSREPLAASLQSCHTIKRLPSKALGHSDTCRRSREPLAASLQSCHTIKRLPSKRWAMVTPADIPGGVGCSDAPLLPITPTEILPIVLLSAFAALRARSRQSLLPRQLRHRALSILPDPGDQ